MIAKHFFAEGGSLIQNPPGAILRTVSARLVRLLKERTANNDGSTSSVVRTSGTANTEGYAVQFI